MLDVNYFLFGLKYPAWQSCGTFVVDSEIQIDPENRMCLPATERYVLYYMTAPGGRKEAKVCFSHQNVNVNMYKYLHVLIKTI